MSLYSGGLIIGGLSAYDIGGADFREGLFLEGLIGISVTIKLVIIISILLSCVSCSIACISVIICY